MKSSNPPTQKKTRSRKVQQITDIERAIIHLAECMENPMHHEYRVRTEILEILGWEPLPKQKNKAWSNYETAENTTTAPPLSSRMVGMSAPLSATAGWTNTRHGGGSFHASVYAASTWLIWRIKQERYEKYSNHLSHREFGHSHICSRRACVCPLATIWMWRPPYPRRLCRMGQDWKLIVCILSKGLLPLITVDS